jgi:hypothetical protein
LGQSQKICVNDLAVAHDELILAAGLLERQLIGPEGVLGQGGDPLEELERLPGGHRIRGEAAIARDPNEGGLGQRAGRKTRGPLASKPPLCEVMMHVRGPGQRDQMAVRITMIIAP